MNEDVLARQWMQMRGELKSCWGKLADDDLERLGGRQAKLVGLVQEAYGYTRDYAAKDVGRRLKEYGDKTGRAVSHTTAKPQDLGAAANKAHEAAAVVGEKIGSVANVTWENAPAVVSAATTGVDGLVSARSYLGEKKFDHLAKDVTALARAYHVQSLLIGVGLGVLLARRPR